jgi:hypothetical protein
MLGDEPAATGGFPLSIIRIASFFAVLLLVAAPVRAQAPEAGLAVITADKLLADVAHLADPALDGRLAGSPGYVTAARWAAERFKSLGLEPGGEDGYLQWFDIEYNAFTATPTLAVAGADGAFEDCAIGADFTARGFSGSGDLSSSVAFVGYGLSQPDRGYDDYAGLDVTGKVVLCFKPNPSWAPGDSTTWAPGSQTPRQKSLVAQAHGAIGLLWFETAAPGKPARAPIGSVLHGPGVMPVHFPQLEISEAVAEKLLGGGAGEAARLRGLIDQATKPHSRALEATAKVSVYADYSAKHPTCNVVGVLRGSDPQLAAQALVIGGHLDHVGRQGPGLYFPGANDNASGASAVLRLAEAFARAGVKPARTVVFVLFSSEESGLEGAKWHAAHPFLPMKDTAAMFNLDCVACGDSIQVGSGKTSPELWARARALDEAGDKFMVTRTWADGGADAAPFHQAGVKTLYWVTTNSYPHLHAPADQPETLNGPLYEKLVRLCFRTAWEVAMGGGS